jgi:nitrite reductase (NADH) large subunit
MAALQNWKCEVCGYIRTGKSPPSLCPICGVESSLFTKVDAFDRGQPSGSPAGWRCTICGYVHKGAAPPDVCPVCSAEKSLFEGVREKAPHGEVPAESGRIVIVGAGVAGVTAAEQARLTAPGAPITLVCGEPGLPYFRLNLTRFLAGEVGEESLVMHDAGWFDGNRIALVEGEVETIDRAACVVTLRDGRTIDYDRLVLATGSHPFVPPLPGVELDGVLTFRTLEDARDIFRRLSPGGRAVIVGGGLLGLETAGALVKRGMDVTLLEGHGVLLPRQLAEPAGRLLLHHVEAFGITVRTNVRLKEIVGEGSVRAVRLDDGGEIAADLVFFATGVRPTSSLARRCDLDVRGGVVVDDGMFTSDPRILACGDGAEHLGVLYGIWPASHTQGTVAGINAAGGAAEFRAFPPSNRLKVLDVDLFSIGFFQIPDASYELFEERSGDVYRRLVCRDGRIVGANLYGDTELAVPIKDAVEGGTQIPELTAILAAMPDFADFCGLNPVSDS